MFDPSLHQFIKKRIEASLSGRTVKWLAEASGVPQSTLSTQFARPKFSIDVLARVAGPLGLSVSEFFAEQHPPQQQEHQVSDDLLVDLEDLIEKHRVRCGGFPGKPGSPETRFRDPESDVG